MLKQNQFADDINYWEAKVKMKELIKKVLKSCRLGKLLYPIVQRIYKIFNIPKKRRLLQRNGLEILRVLDSTLHDLNIEYFVDYGTLLGVIREGGFIKTDDDIDITICNPEVDARMLVRQLLERGFEFIHALEYQGKTRLFSMSWRGTSVDFYLRDWSEDRAEYWIYGIYFDPHLVYPGEEWNSCRRICYPLSMVPERFQFKGIIISIPHGAEDHLKFEYGVDWRIPDPSCKSVSDKKVLVMSDFARRVISLEKFLNGE